MNKRKVAIKILNTLEKQRFADWYNNQFDNYISAAFPEGDRRRLTEEQILEQIEKLFNL